MDDEVHVSTHGDVTVVAMSGEVGVELTESLRVSPALPAAGGAARRRAWRP